MTGTSEIKEKVLRVMLKKAAQQGRSEPPSEARTNFQHPASIRAADRHCEPFSKKES
jgi:hypothetical protein